MTAVVRFPANTRGRDFIVGDIHGMFPMLKGALTALNFNEEADRLFSVGDLVDRGPDSAAAKQWCAYPWFHAVRGNHEEMCLTARSDLHLLNGGEWFLKLDAEEQESFRELFRSLPFAIEIEDTNGAVDIGIVHADPVFDYWPDLIAALESENKSSQLAALWSRAKIDNIDITAISGVGLVVCGHTVTTGSTLLGNTLYIDTGACFGMSLTLYEPAVDTCHTFLVNGAPT